MRSRKEEKLFFFFFSIFFFHRQSSGLRLWATMVFHLVGKSTRQGWREDVEEAHGVHHGQREPRVFCSEYTVGENGLRREERWKNLVDGHLSRLHRYDVTITDRRRCYALTAMSDRVMRSDTSVSSNANLCPPDSRENSLPTPFFLPFFETAFLEFIIFVFIVEQSCHGRGDVTRLNDRYLFFISRF